MSVADRRSALQRLAASWAVRIWLAAMGLASALALAVGSANASELPRIETMPSGRHVLLVDGQPFTILGAQANNSSNNVNVLPQVWSTITALHANTLEMPVAWDQIEPREGQFDFSFVDALLDQARAHHVRLVLLWFGTWKNGGPGYTPEWVKTDVARFPRKLAADGTPLPALSPFSPTTLAADKRAFEALMQHLARADAQNTVIMVQVENEAGAFGIPRDHRPEAEALFAGQVPASLTQRLGRPSGTWRQVFGALSNQAFMSWYTASYIDQVAAAGKAIKDLPMYCNAALSDPLAKTVDPNWVSSGSPDWNMIDVWKAAAPHIDLVAPDIYYPQWDKVTAFLDAYDRPDNPLMVPEIGNAVEFARYFWPVMGHGGIGFAPFGMDATGYANYPLGAKRLDQEVISAFAAPYEFIAPMDRGWARVLAGHPSWGFAKGPDAKDQSVTFGDWKVTAQFDRWLIGDESWTFVKPDPAPTAGKPVGGGVVIQTGADTFLVAGYDARVHFTLAHPGQRQQWQFVSVEEGSLDDAGNWRPLREWNGDQTDYGLNLGSRPTLLRVRLGKFD